MPKVLELFRRESDDLVIVVLRFAVGAVFLWFGVDKWIHPELWYGWMPPFLLAQKLMPLDTMLWFMGAFEFAVGVSLVAGRLIRPASVIAAFFLLSIIFMFGANEATIRDNAIIGACLALFIHENAKAKRQVPRSTVSLICSIYVLFLFITGVMYLRSPLSG